MLTYENEKGVTRSRASIVGLRMYSFPSLKSIKVGRVRVVTDDTTLYLSAIFGDLATSIFPNLRFSEAKLVGGAKI